MDVLGNDDRFSNVPVVSVFVNAYNQEDYISTCLDSILSQEVDFPFEILVSDDASTDNTASIIRSYAEAHPDVFIAVLHDENQFSKGINHNRTYLFPRSRGRYIAFCEGDDYWTDPHKLQRQYEAMEKHQEATWCVHSSMNVAADTGEKLSVEKSFDHDCVLQFKDTGAKVQLAATASFFIRREAYASYLDSEPSKVKCHGDFKMSRFFSLTGSTIYLADVMSAYRVFAKSSINSRLAASSDWREIAKQNALNRVNYLRALDEWSGGSHSQEIAAEVDNLEYLDCLWRKDIKELRAKWPERFATEPLSTKFKVSVLGAHPRLQDAIHSYKLKHLPYFGLKG